MKKISDIISFLNPVSVQGAEAEDRYANSLQHDSRLAGKDDLFIAVKGFTTDGHKYISQVVDNGVSVVVAQKDLAGKLPESKNVTYILLNDTREAWSPLALFMADDPQKKLKIAAITGTNGKTTVSTLVHQALSSIGYKTGLLGTISRMAGEKSFESRLTTGDATGVAADLKMMADEGCTHVVMEASSHALDQKRISGLDISAAAFTNLSHDHLDYHKSMEAYATAKKILFDGLNPEAVAIINADDQFAEFMVSDTHAQVWKFGMNEGLEIISNDANGLVISVDDQIIQSSMIGEFNARNLAAAYLICRSFGVSASTAATALGECAGAKGRMERVADENLPDVKQPAVIVDYAHTPDALENVSQTLFGIKGDGKLIVTFGCGGDRDRKKRPEMAKVAERYADMIIVTSDNPRTENPEDIIGDIMEGFDDSEEVLVYPERERAIRQAVLKAAVKDIVLIAGKGHETYQEIDGVRHHFDDCEVALAALKKRNSGTSIQTSDQMEAR